MLLLENWRNSRRTRIRKVAICRMKGQSAAVSKTVGRRKAPRGFESHPLRWQESLIASVRQRGPWPPLSASVIVGPTKGLGRG